jgi:Rod binding domain-containing protein
MSSIQSALLSKPLPLSEMSSSSSSPFKSKSGAQGSDKVAKDFESVFTSMMLKEMRSSLEPGSLFGEDSNDVYGGMFDQYMGQHMADGGGIGLAKMVREALDRMPSSTSTSSPSSPKAAAVDS